jgi:hypothetical protein
MAVGDLITAARYNAIQNRINTIMGVGSGNSGYGQTLASSQRTGGSTQNATLSDILNLRTDMIKARQHQAGGDQGPAGTNAFPLVTTSDQITDAYAANLESQMTVIETNKLVIDDTATNRTIVTGAATSSRSTAWSATITHNITINFGSANAARYYFNSGGQLRFRAAMSGTPSGTNGTAIFNDWQSMLSGVGTVIFNHNSTSKTGAGAATVASAIGFYQLTTSNQTIMTKTGSGTYAANTWIINARRNSTSTTVFIDISFNDNKGGNPNFDEPVTGTITSSMDTYRATGTNVSVPQPSISNTSTL